MRYAKTLSDGKADEKRKEMKRTMKRGKRLMAALLSAAMVLSGTAGISFGKNTAQAAAKKVTLKLNKKSVTLKKGKSTTLKIVKKNVKKIKGLKWSVKNKKIAKVSKKGVVKAKKTGSTTVKAAFRYKAKGSKKFKKKTLKCTVKVKGNTSPKATVKPLVAVQGITLSETKKTLNVKESFQLTASVSPAEATNPKVVFRSDNNGVASVAEDGTVTAAAKGTANIIARSEDQMATAVCVVTVTNRIEVHTQAELTQALTSAADQLTIKTDAKEKLTIPAGKYPSTDLVINAPNGEVENNAVFKSVTIQQIARDTYIENAKGNRISVESAQAHVVIGSDGEASVVINQASKDVVLENNGVLSSVDLNTSGKVKINGSSRRTVKVLVNDTADLTTNQALDIDAIKKFALTILSGGEDTVIAVSTEEAMPVIYGLGIIIVTISDTGEVVSVVSDNNGADENAVDVTFTGAVTDVEGELLSGIDVYVVPYASGYDAAGIEQDSNVVKMQTDSDGHYTTDAIKTGNYLLVAKGEGYADTSQILVIGTAQGSTYTNEELVMIPSEWEGKSGNISGRVVDSATGNRITDGITVRLRQNRNNIIGKALQTTTTDEEGCYSFENIAAGCYTVQFVDMRQTMENRYTTTSLNVVVKPDGVANGDISMTTNLTGGEVRFILSWGDEDSGAIADADSHLVGNLSDGSKFHTYFSDMIAYQSDGQTRYAALDVDDTEWVGPETTTIYDVQPGKYCYYVHDYSNRSSGSCDQLSKSSVKVSVYRGARLVADYNVPQQDGTLWHVCDYDSRTDTFKTINRMSYESSPSDVGILATEKVNSILSQIEDYYSLLEEGTGEDILTALEEYREQLQAIPDDDDSGKAEELWNEVNSYYNDLISECSISIYGDNIDEVSWSEEEANKASLYLYSSAEEVGEYTVSCAEEDSQIEETEPTDSDAFAAWKVTAPNGHTRVFELYIAVDFYDIAVNSVMKGSEKVDFGSSWYDTEDGDEYTMIRIYGDADSRPEDYTITFDSNLVTVETNKVAVDEEYTLTISYGGQSRTYVVRVVQKPIINATDNIIYQQQYSGNSITCVGKEETLGDAEIIVGNDAKTPELEDEYSNRQEYWVSFDDISYWIYYYPISLVTQIDEIEFYDQTSGDTFYASIDNEENMITVNHSDLSEADLQVDYLSYWTSGFTREYSYEAVDGEDYIGTLSIWLMDQDGNRISDSEKIYEVYPESEE